MKNNVPLQRWDFQASTSIKTLIKLYHYNKLNNFNENNNKIK